MHETQALLYRVEDIYLQYFVYAVDAGLTWIGGVLKMPGFVMQLAPRGLLHCKNKLRPRENQTKDEKKESSKSHDGRCKSHAGHHSLSFLGQGRPVFPFPSPACCLLLLCCCTSGAAALPLDMTPWDTMRVIEPSPTGSQLSAMPCCQPWQRQRVGIPTHLMGTSSGDSHTLDAGLDFMRVWSSFSSSLPGSFADMVPSFYGCARVVCVWAYPHTLLGDEPVLHLAWLLFLNLLGCLWCFLDNLLWRIQHRARVRLKKRLKLRAKRRKALLTRMAKMCSLRTCIFSCRLCGRRRVRHARGFHLCASGLRRSPYGLCIARGHLSGLSGMPKHVDGGETAVDRDERGERPSGAYFDWLRDHLLDMEGGSSQATRKKRAAKQQLLSLLQQFARPKPRRRRKTSPKREHAPEAPADNGLALAKALLSGLKQCLNKGGSEDDVLGVLADAFQSKALGLQSRQVNPVEPSPTPEDWEDEVEKNWSTDDYEWQDWSEHEWSSANASWSSHAGKSKSARSVVVHKWDNHSKYWRDPAWAGKSSRSDNWPSLESRYSSVATAVRAADWKSGCPPRLISYFGLKQSLLNGMKPEGNLVEIWDEEYLDELVCLWESFGDPFACTVRLSGHACRRDGALVTQLSVTRGSFGPALEKVGLLQLGQKDGPWMCETTVVAKDKVPQIPSDRATIRITAPAAYRQSFRAKDGDEESASEVVRDLALSSGVPVAQLLGGNWSVRTVGESNSLEGFIRVKEATATKLLSVGGMRGIFVARVGKQAAVSSESKPFWTKRLKDESRESYFRRVLGLSKRRAQPIIYRSGGGSDLGFPAWIDGDAVEARPKHVLVRGVPRVWVDEDVVSFLTGLSWSEVKVTSRVRGVWHVMAVPPLSDIPVSSWKYSLEGSDPACVIDVQVAESSARKVAVVAAVKGPSSRLAKESPAETVAAPGAKKVERDKSPAPTQLDPPGDGDGGDRGRSRSRERKPPRDAADSSNPAVSSGDAAPEPKRARGNKTLHDPDAAVLNGWKIVDLQGVGDCFFRCVAFHQARRQKPQKLLNNTEAQTKGAWIRAQAKLHAQNHPETFSSLFDSEAAYKNWLSKVGKMTTYAEGAIIQAVSEKLGCPIVAWVKKEGCWERFVVSGRFANSYACCAAGQSPVVVLLENKHFTLLTPPTVEGADDTVPYAWLRATPTIVLDLTGGMVADDVVEEAEEAPCDGELDGEATPSLHSLVFSHEGDACSVDTPSLHTMVPASYVASRRSDAGLAVGTPSLHTYCVGVNTSQAAASSNDTPSRVLSSLSGEHLILKLTFMCTFVHV